jgi:FtsP/CotA-like multicopper oxidase with cupredoxin domain
MAADHRDAGKMREVHGISGQIASSAAAEGTLSTRRQFLTGALAVSGLALSGVTAPAGAQSPAPAAPAQGSSQELRTIGEIRSRNGKMRAVITVRNEPRSIPGLQTTQPPMLRYFEGKGPDGVWPPTNEHGVLRPGPTLRARVGDQVEITFLNHIKVEDFPGGSIDNAETGTGTGCDVSTDQSGKNIYPEGAGDTFPDCFHGSSTANLHFHGTHVPPDGLGDNVLAQIRPNLRVTEESVQSDFARIFAAAESGHPPAHWDDLPESWRNKQLGLLREYDDTAVWRGVRGSPGHPALPLENRLLPQTEALIAMGQWPQYQIGAYPYCFKLTEYVDAQGKPTGYAAGQCPGTHWYHAHKHGSTAINVFNGMAGVFVIEGDYDDALARIYANLRQTEKVLIVQQFVDIPNLELPRSGPPTVLVNGQLNPTITMRPGEVQLWRLVNATVQDVITLARFTAQDGLAPEVRQIAQDGVQFFYDNYKDQPLLSPSTAGAPPSNTFVPGNRVDILVKAPDKAAPQPYSFNGILTLTVAGAPISPAMDFPSETNYPRFPCFLEDIDPTTIRIKRTIDFGWEAGRTAPGPIPTAPHYMLDGRQFSEGRYDQTMVLGDAEEWTLTNSTTQIAHPFHIHINPFQVIEIFDPKFPNKVYKPAKNFVWQDTIAIPPAIIGEDGKLTKGHVKIRHRFVDFPGSFVLHCHILAHEDRGMMQLIRVVPGETIIKHH